MRRTALIALAAITAATLAGCASLGTTAAGAPSSAASGSAPAGSPSAPAPSPSAPPCTSHACIASLAEQSMPGTTAEDGSVVTKAVCRKSSVKHNAGDTWTVSCDVTYTDRTVWSGLVTLLPASDQVSWQPEYQVS